MCEKYSHIRRQVFVNILCSVLAHQTALGETNLSLEPLECELPLHLVLDPGVGTVLPLQQRGPAVSRLSVSLHQDNLDETLVL